MYSTRSTTFYIQYRGTQHKKFELVRRSVRTVYILLEELKVLQYVIPGNDIYVLIVETTVLEQTVGVRETTDEWSRTKNSVV
jgi:hypothetical protein